MSFWLNIFIVSLILSLAGMLAFGVMWLGLKKKHHALVAKSSEQSLKGFYPELNPNPVMRFSLKGKLEYANPASFLLMEHWGLEEGAKIPEDWLPVLRKVMTKQEKESIEIALSDAYYILTFTPVPHTKAIHLYGLDITEKNRAIKAVEQKTLYDQTTQLPNRTLLMDYLKLEIERIQPNHKIFTFLIYIVDFSELMSVHDQKIVSGYMQALAKIFQDHMEDEATLGRFGERGFLIIQSAFFSNGQAVSYAQRLLDQMSQPIEVYGVKIMPRLSIGISIYPDDSDNPDMIFRNVKLAQSRAIATRKPILFYQSGMDEQVQAKRRILIDLHQALKNQELMLYYQPQMSLSKNAYTGAESLLRWQHSSKGFISPFFFVAAAEESGLIIPIGRWIIDTVCRDAKRFKEAGHPIKLALNLSALQFMQEDLVPTIMNAVHKHGISPQDIECEITEGVAIQDVSKTIDKMHALRKEGFSLAIDDFGTGYSSLSYLQKFPIQKLKIDRAFIKDMHVNKQTFNMTRGIIELGHSLNLKIVAEGAEHKEQIEMLNKLGCDLIQGYFYSPAVPIDKLLTLLEDNKKR